MPQRKDPDIPVRQALVLVPVARRQRREDRAARHPAHRGEDRRERPASRRSNRTPAPASRPSTSRWSKASKDTGKEFDDIKLKLDAIQRPAGGRRPDRVREGLRRHRGADADRGEPAESTSAQIDLRGRCVSTPPIRKRARRLPRRRPSRRDRQRAPAVGEPPMRSDGTLGLFVASAEADGHARATRAIIEAAASSAVDARSDTRRR